MKSSLLFKPFNNRIVTVCFAILSMLLIPAKGYAVAIAPIPGGPDIVCQSAIPSAITLTDASLGFPANSGAWSITSGGGMLSTTAQTATPALVTYTPAANYVILKLTTNGSLAVSATRTVTVNALPAILAITGTATVCVEATTQLADAIADLENDPNVPSDKMEKLKSSLKQLKYKTSITIRNGEIIK